jgi:2'-5' RNA ligase
MKKSVLIIINILIFQITASMKGPLIDADDSHTYRTVYPKDYGVVILAQNPVKSTALNINAEIAKHHKTCAPIVPHITLFQGQFEIEVLPTIFHMLKKYAVTLNPFEITMDARIEKDYASNNTIWKVKPDHSFNTLRLFYNTLHNNHNNSLKLYSSSFLIPSIFTPHIILAHEIQQEELFPPINTFLPPQSALDPVLAHWDLAYSSLSSLSKEDADKQLKEILEQTKQTYLKFIATNLAIARIDKAGNIYRIIEKFPFDDSKS